MSDFWISLQEPVFWLILSGGFITLFNRLAGHYILRRFEPIHYRLEAALEAVPIAVLTAIIAPAYINAGPAEWAALLICMVLALRLSFMPAFFVSVILLIILREMGL